MLSDSLVNTILASNTGNHKYDVIRTRGVGCGGDKEFLNILFFGHCCFSLFSGKKAAAIRFLTKQLQPHRSWELTWLLPLESCHSSRRKRAACYKCYCKLWRKNCPLCNTLEHEYTSMYIVTYWWPSFSFVSAYLIFKYSFRKKSMFKGNDKYVPLHDLQGHWP